MRSSVYSHLHALDWSDQNHEILYYNANRNAPAWLRHLRWDAVILHNTFLCRRWQPDFFEYKRRLNWIAELQCLKVALPQDDYDHSELLDEWLNEWGVSVILGVCPPAYWPILYPTMHKKAAFYEALTGYIDPRVAQNCGKNLLPIAQRPLDVVYRAAHLPYWFGSLGQLKVRIAGVAAERAAARHLKYDISTRPADTITGEKWLDFVASSKAIVGTESGASALDRRGELHHQIREMLKTKPELTFDQVSSQLPAGWDSYRFVAIGPRHLEAVITKTCQLLVEGEYNGILQPHVHYIPIKPDFSDMDGALEKLQDTAYVQNMVERAYEEIYTRGTYTNREFAQKLDAILSAHRGRASTSQHVLDRVRWSAGQTSARLSDVYTTEKARARLRIKRILGIS